MQALRKAKLISDVKYGKIRDGKIRVPADSQWLIRFTLYDEVVRSWLVQRDFDHYDFNLKNTALINALPNMQRYNCHAGADPDEVARARADRRVRPDRCIARFDFQIDDDESELTYDAQKEQLMLGDQVRLPILVLEYNYETVATFEIKKYRMTIKQGDR